MAWGTITVTGRTLRTAAGVLLSVLAAGLLTFAGGAFWLYAYCEDSCDKPPWAFWPAVGAALPYAAAGLVVMTLASALLMRGRARVVRALGRAVVSCALFLGLLWVLIDPLELFDRVPAFVVVPVVFAVLWGWFVAALARRAPL